MRETVTAQEIVAAELIELEHMKRTLPLGVLVELRGPEVVPPYGRLTNIWGQPHNYAKNLSGFGGNSNGFIRKRGKIVEHFFSGKGRMDLGVSDKLDIVLLQLRIEDTRSDGVPVFANPQESEDWFSVGLMHRDYGIGNWLKHPLDPLFNISQQGDVLARTSDVPTAADMYLLNEILTAFEDAAI